jgi:hypothetical protein
MGGPSKNRNGPMDRRSGLGLEIKYIRSVLALFKYATDRTGPFGPEARTGPVKPCAEDTHQNKSSRTLSSNLLFYCHTIAALQACIPIFNVFRCYIHLLLQPVSYPSTCS